jgi:hypothetical protein
MKNLWEINKTMIGITRTNKVVAWSTSGVKPNPGDTADFNASVCRSVRVLRYKLDKRTSFHILKKCKMATVETTGMDWGKIIE